jgi:murein DD-endopeptidase MepM/ murein hydrolase activator NlpD
MRTPVDHGYSLPFTVAMSFLMGIVATIAVYTLREMTPADAAIKDVNATASTVETTLQAPEPAPERVEPAVAPSTPAETVSVEALSARDLKIPVDGVDREDLRDTFTESRGSRSHEALDILAPRNAKVLAVEDGRIQKLFTSKAGGLTIYEFDPTETFAYYYAHLDRYAEGLREGQPVQRGDVIGYVGSSGNASPDAPHLHFAIFRLGPERQWWKGEAINPYLALTSR